MTVEEEAKIGHFYKIKLHLVCEIHNITCMDSAAVLCRIGTDEMVVHNTNLSTCPGISISYWCTHTTDNTMQIKL